MDAGEAIVRVLIVSSRDPWPPYSGDRLRTTMWLDALQGVADVTLVTVRGGEGSRPRSAAPHLSVAYARRTVPNVFSVLRRGLPLHTLMAATHDWRGAIEGSFDAAVVVLSRLDPWVRDLPARFTVLDAIDSLAHSMQERAREASSPFARRFWQHEAKAMEALERDAGARYDRVLVVNGDEASWFGPRAMAVPIGVPIRPVGGAPRRYDFAFWGRLAYFANRDAAMHLANDVWPRIRAALPNASLVIAGADAPREIRRLHGRDGITVLSPVSDVSQLAREVRVALFPIHFGTGQLTKVLEAAEAACAIVASPRAMRGLDPLRPHVVVAETGDAFAAAAVETAQSPRAESIAAAVRGAVERHYSRDAMKKNLAAIVAGSKG